jgi:tripartite ATP-independent transporter DctM subunit
MGGMFAGWFTPTEAGAVGFAGMLIVSVIFKRFSFAILKKSLISTMVMSGMIYAMMAAAMCFGKFFTLSRIPESLQFLVQNLHIPAIAVIMVLTLIYLILGCFIDGVALILITVPIFLPVVQAIGFDPIWFGLYIVVIVGLGGITPPVGVSCYIVSAVSEAPLQKVFRGSVPFLFAYLAMALLLAVFPGIATWLPNLMM